MFIQCPLDAVRWATHLMISASTPATFPGRFSGPVSRRTAPTWLLSGSLSLAPSFSSRPLFSFVSGRKLESSSCYLSSSHTLWVWSSTPLIHSFTQGFLSVHHQNSNKNKLPLCSPLCSLYISSHLIFAVILFRRYCCNPHFQMRILKQNKVMCSVTQRFQRPCFCIKETESPTDSDWNRDTCFSRGTRAGEPFGPGVASLTRQRQGSHFWEPPGLLPHVCTKAALYSRIGSTFM